MATTLLADTLREIDAIIGEREKDRARIAELEKLVQEQKQKMLALAQAFASEVAKVSKLQKAAADNSDREKDRARIAELEKLVQEQKQEAAACNSDREKAQARIAELEKLVQEQEQKTLDLGRAYDEEHAKVKQLQEAVGKVFVRIVPAPVLTPPNVAAAELPFKCDTCKRTFAAECNLRNHMRAHARAAVFLSQTAAPTPEVQRSPSEITQEFEVPEGGEEEPEDALVLASSKPVGKDTARPFACVACNKTFAKLVNLQSHIYQKHTDKKLKEFRSQAHSTGTDKAAEREVPPDPSLKPEDLVGKRVRIWWPLEKEWFDGRVTALGTGTMHLVTYDDGDEFEEQLLGNVYPTRGWRLLQ
jgi:hypothetical protein